MDFNSADAVLVQLDMIRRYELRNVLLRGCKHSVEYKVFILFQGAKYYSLALRALGTSALGFGATNVCHEKRNEPGRFGVH